ncbi:hypothetical protein DRJ48_02880 [Candidatus Woesearchaeota archaeon]|nr:hypothetical protein [Candidatus Woesearchaeota archaeon]RLE42733.1 MAG: hypothetical protein DRJ48_02880 [Candidatus Woesearchaeota archaeon]
MAIPNPFKGYVRIEELEKIKASFKKIREDLDEHLEAINQNTNEIQSNYEYITWIEAKLDAINEKLEALQLKLSEIDQGKARTTKIDLSHEEKKVFLAIYKYSDSRRFISYSEIGKRLGLPISLVRFYITNLIEKNIPIIKKYKNREVLVSLDPEFRELQAKANIVNINESITRFI